MTMTVNIRGTMYDGSIRTKAVVSPVRIVDIKEIAKLILKEDRIEHMIQYVFKKFAIPFSVGLGALSVAGKTFASSVINAPLAGNLSGLGDRLMPMIHMVQDFALPVGIVVSSWGMIEMMMGNIESGKHKMKWAIIGFIGMFLIPEVFYAIRDAFHAKV